MQESFWWWQCSDRYIVPLLPTSWGRSLSPPVPLGRRLSVKQVCPNHRCKCLSLQIACYSCKSMFVAVNGDSISIGDKLTFAAFVKTGGSFTATKSAFATRKLSFFATANHSKFAELCKTDDLWRPKPQVCFYAAAKIGGRFVATKLKLELSIPSFAACRSSVVPIPHPLRKNTCWTKSRATDSPPPFF